MWRNGQICLSGSLSNSFKVIKHEKGKWWNEKNAFCVNSPQAVCILTQCLKTTEKVAQCNGQWWFLKRPLKKNVCWTENSSLSTLLDFILKKILYLFLYLHLSLYLSLLLLLACTYLNNAWDLVLGALPLSVCLFKIIRFMYSTIVSRFG